MPRIVADVALISDDRPAATRPVV